MLSVPSKKKKKKITFINHNLPLGAAACAALVSAILELLR